MLHYHLIMCVKYRNKVIDDAISTRLKEIFVKIAPTYNITLEEWNHDIDHVHILFRGQPNTEISKFIVNVNIKMYKKGVRTFFWTNYPLMSATVYVAISPSFIRY